MKRGNHSKSRGSKALVMALAFILIMGAAIGTTLAWFTDTTDPVVNTFTVGNIDIELDENGATENKQSFKMIPGYTMKKDPEVTVKAGSEACWLFVELTESANFGTFMEYNMDDAWTKLEDGVWYQVTTYSAADQTYPVLLNNEVKVRQNITKEMLNALDADESYPTMEVTAYAVQYASIGSAAEAWALAQGE